MRALFFRSVTVIALAGLGLAASACGAAAPAAAGPVTSTLTEAQAREAGENAFQALNSGDYAAWSRDWSAAMKAAISEQDFLAWREQVVQSQGQYQAITALELQPGLDERYFRWVYTLQFEQGSGRITLSFLKEDNRIVGVFPETAQ